LLISSLICFLIDDEQRRQDDEMQYKVHLDDSDNIGKWPDIEFLNSETH